MDTCPQCGNNFDAWYSKNKGKPQKFPYKTCFSCKQKKAEQQEQPQGNGKQDAAREMIELLGEIRDGIVKLQDIELDIKQILFSMVRVKGKQEIGKSFDEKKDIPTIEDEQYPIPPDGIPF